MPVYPLVNVLHSTFNGMRFLASNLIACKLRTIRIFLLRRSNSGLLRLRYVFNSKIHFNDPFDDLVLQFLILLGHH
jgi:hypothetical protein